MEGVNLTQATWTKEPDADTIRAAVHAVVAAEFTTVISKYALAFKSNELIKEYVTLWPP